MSYYKTLGVTTNASKDVIKRAYRALAMRYHPDRYPQGGKEQAHAEMMFKDIQQAYEALSSITTKDPDAFENSMKAPTHFYSNVDVSVDEWVSGFTRTFVLHVPLFEDCKQCYWKRHQHGYQCHVCCGRKSVPVYEATIAFKPLSLIHTAMRQHTELCTSDGRRVSMYFTLTVDKLHNVGINLTNLHIQMDARMPRAVMRFGGDWSVRLGTAGHMLKICVPEKVKAGMVLRLRGRGVQNETHRGDMLIKMTNLRWTVRTAFQEMVAYCTYGSRYALNKIKRLRV